MIKITNLGLMINGRNIENEAEMTTLLNYFFSKCKDLHDEEFAIERMTEIGHLAVDGADTPSLSSKVDIEISIISGIKMIGGEDDIVKALGAALSVLYHDRIEHVGEEIANEWLVNGLRLLEVWR